MGKRKTKVDEWLKRRTVTLDAFSYEQACGFMDEVRAMRTVARAAADYRRVGPMSPGFRCVCHGQDVCNGCRLERALARLARASGEGGK